MAIKYEYIFLFNKIDHYLIKFRLISWNEIQSEGNQIVSVLVTRSSFQERIWKIPGLILKENNVWPALMPPCMSHLSFTFGWTKTGTKTKKKKQKKQPERKRLGVAVLEEHSQLLNFRELVLGFIDF